MENETKIQSASRKVSGEACPDLFSYSDYREFLRDAYVYKRSKNSKFTESAFVRKAGLGKNSRGYLSLVIKKKRNLTPKTIYGFSEALGLSPKESIYFENLVLFNQATSSKEKEYYFKRLSASHSGGEASEFEILKSQYAYYSNWYLVAVRELVGLDDFFENPEWISKRLKGKITRAQASQAIKDLLTLGLISRDYTGKLKQSDPLLKFSDTAMNIHVIEKFHGEMIDRAHESLLEDSYVNRSVSCVTLCSDSDRFEEMREDISKFREMINKKYGEKNKKSDSVIQVGIQLFYLSPPQAKRSEK